MVLQGLRRGGPLRSRGDRPDTLAAQGSFWGLRDRDWGAPPEWLVGSPGPIGMWDFLCAHLNGKGVS